MYLYVRMYITLYKSCHGLSGLEPRLGFMSTTSLRIHFPTEYSNAILTLSFDSFILSFSLSLFLGVSRSLCLHLSASHSSRSAGDKDPVRRYWNKWPPALLSTGSTQLNLMLGCPCVFFLSFRNKLIYSNVLMSPFASASPVISSALS